MKLIGKLFSRQQSMRVVVDSCDPPPVPATAVKVEQPPEPAEQEVRPTAPHGYSKRKHPILYWEPLKEMTYPEPIRAADHHQAHCVDHRGRPVPGKCFFQPPPGTVLPAGFHDLEVTFIPDNDSKFACVNAVRSIQIKKRRPKVRWQVPPVPRPPSPVPPLCSLPVPTDPF